MFAKELGEWKRKKEMFFLCVSVQWLFKCNDLLPSLLLRTQSIHLVLLNRTLVLISRQRHGRINLSTVSEKELLNLKS